MFYTRVLSLFGFAAANHADIIVHGGDCVHPTDEQRYEFQTDADLLAILDETLIEYLAVDASRMFVRYREAVLDL